MKRLIWIDDSFSGMKNVAEGMFPHLWKKDIASKAFFLGDYSQQGGEALNESAVREFKRTVNQLFDDWIPRQLKDGEYNGMTPGDFAEALGLKDSAELVPEDKWRDLHWLLERLKAFAESGGKVAVALDIILFRGEHSQLEPKWQDETRPDPQPIFSMEIYHALTAGNIPCLVYTSYLDESPTFRNNWKSAYEREYSEEKAPDPVSRRQLTQADRLEGFQELLQKFEVLFKSE